MCLFLCCCVVCVDDTNNNGKEVCKKKKEGRNTIFNTHTRERILLKKTKKQTNQKKEHPTDRPTLFDSSFLSHYMGKK